MALSPAILNLQNRDALQNLLHNRTGNTPLTLPGNARGTPPANAVPNSNPAAGLDTLNLTGQPVPAVNGNLALDGSGVYRLINASSLSFSAQSLNVRLGSGALGGSGSNAGRGALAALSGALGADSLTGSDSMDRLRSSLQALGLDDKSIRDLMLIAGMLRKLDPEAFDKFVDSMESFAKKLGDAQSAPALNTGQSAPAPAPAQGGQGQGSQGTQSFQLHYVSVSISFTEVTATASAGQDGASASVEARHFEVKFERLEISMGTQQQPPPQGDPVVLDVNGDGADLRPTSDGVKFDLTGSGQAVQTAFVKGDDALLFYDANMNGLLDNGKELVGNRVPGLDGMAELSAMDRNGDGQVTAADPAWSLLRLFQDLNGDGQSSPGEIHTLEQLGIAGLSALWDRAESQDGEGLRRVGTSAFTRADGSKGLMLDYYFGYQPAPEKSGTA